MKIQADKGYLEKVQNNINTPNKFNFLKGDEYFVDWLARTFAFSSVGIFCLSSWEVFEDDSAQLMFAHYASNNEGLALVYESNDTEKVLPVKYDTSYVLRGHTPEEFERIKIIMQKLNGDDNLSAKFDKLDRNNYKKEEFTEVERCILLSFLGGNTELCRKIYNSSGYNGKETINWHNGQFKEDEMNKFLLKSPKWEYEKEHRLFAKPDMHPAHDFQLRLKEIFYTRKFKEKDTLAKINSSFYDEGLGINCIFMPSDDSWQFAIEGNKTVHEYLKEKYK